MNGPFYVGATGLQSLQRALDVVANNIANLNTPAFKRSDVRFSELAPSDGLPQGAAGGVSAEAGGRVMIQGDLRETGKPMDVAIDGDGFIELLGAGGETMLWRGGALQVNPDGALAAANGLALKSALNVPEGATKIAIGRDGKVTAVAAGASEPTEIGRIEITRVKDPAALVGAENGLFRVTSTESLVSSAAGEEGAGSIVQGSLEASNVQLTEEMVKLLLMQRAYAANAQVVQAGDQLMAIANGLKR
jgi:flagellar basal-body rod protein FlgG